MRAGGPLRNCKATSPTGAESTAIAELIRLLVLQCMKGREHSGQQDGVEILIDADVDGARYSLVRLPQIAHAPCQLSPREREIARMVAKGYPNKVIAEVLNISTWTVCTHMRRIFAKLGVGSRAAMVARILEPGGPEQDPRIARGPALRKNTPSTTLSGTPATASQGFSLPSSHEALPRRVG